MRNEIVEKAIEYIGYTEGDNNDTIFGDWYGLSNEPWCAMFVSYCADQVGIPQDIIQKFASCTAGFKWFEEQGVAIRENIVPEVGDIIFFVWNNPNEPTPDHVGIVERVENGKVYTIEGNRSDKVQQYEYDIDDWHIYGYAQPNYEEEVSDLQYKVHLEEIGWTDYINAGEVAGTTGESRRMEAIILQGNNGLDLKYRVHMEELGWSDWVNNGEIAGTIGESRRIEAIEIECNRPLEVQEHIEQVGWMPTSKGNHIKIGTEGKALRLEAFKINI